MTEGRIAVRIVIIFVLAAILIISAATIAAQKRGSLTSVSESGQGINFSTEIIELTDDAGQNYFVNYRIKRQQFREEAKEMLSPLLECDILSTRQEAQKQWLQLSKAMVAEGQIENDLKIRGFKDVVSQVNNNKATVIILAKELKPEEIKTVRNVVTTVTGLTKDRIDVIARD